MPVSFKHKFIFIHIPKCGGSTIENFFGIAKVENLYNKNVRVSSKDGKVEHALQHMTPDLIRGCLSGGEFNSFFKFTFVRHPYKRVISEYFWQHQNKLTLTGEDHFNTWLRKFYANIDTDRKLPQHKYVFDKEKQIPDFIGRVENFDKDFNSILDKIGWKGSRDIKTYGKTKKPNAHKLLSAQNKSYIARLYRRDFELFGYEL